MLTNKVKIKLPSSKVKKSKVKIKLPSKIIYKPSKPIISYYGGKQRMASKIVKLLPPHTVYVEPFFGGGAVFFKRPIVLPGNSHYFREVINDADEHLINLYRIVRDRPNEFIEKIKLINYSEAEHQKSKELLRTTTDSLTRALAYYVNIWQSFAQKLNGGWGTSVISRNHASTFYRAKNNLIDLVDRLSRCYISASDALLVIKRFDSPQTCFYCDPPYPGTDQGYYVKFTQEDLKKLISLIQVSKGSFVLSVYDNQVVPEQWIKHEFKARCSAINSKDTIHDRKRVECVWVIDRSDNIPAKLKPHVQYYGE